MRIFKTRRFHKWAAGENLSDERLKKAINEMEDGLVDAELGGNVYKKRIGIQGRGKRGGVRTLLPLKIEDRAFFIYGFPKSERANINADELKALKIYARELLAYSDKALEKALKENIVIEVNNDDE